MIGKAIICHDSLMASFLSMFPFFFQFVCILDKFLVPCRYDGQIDAGNCEALPLQYSFFFFFPMNQIILSQNCFRRKLFTLSSFPHSLTILLGTAHLQYGDRGN